MTNSDETRPDPDVLLNALKKDEEQRKKAKLRIFFGMSAGVGKTYEMLRAAHDASAKNIDVVIGYVETHQRRETEALIQNLPIIPRKRIEYRGTVLEEMDLDAVLARKPKLVLVDELAHTNAPGSRHKKRYQDVQELLDNGIDVYTTLNVQHLESRADAVAQISGTTVWETVPDSIFDKADEVEIIDISPDDLLKRLADGKVYTAERSRQAIQNFFSKGNLTALREMSLRLTAERVDHQLRDYLRTQRVSRPWKTSQRLLVGITSSPNSIHLIRWARRMAYTMDASWVAVYVETSNSVSETAKEQLLKNIKLARELGAEVITTSDEDIAGALIRVAQTQNATQILVGKSNRSFPQRNRILEKMIENSGGLDIYVVGSDLTADKQRGKFRIPEIHSSFVQYLGSALTIILVAALCYPLHSYLGYQTISLIMLLAVALLPLKFGSGPVLLAAAVSALVWDYFFIPPRFTFSITAAPDILMFLAYFAIAFVTGTLTARIRAREKAVRQREERAVALYSLTRDLSVAQKQDDVVLAAVTNIQKFFDAKVGVFLGDSDGDIFTQAHPASTYPVDSKEFGVAAWVYWNEKKAGKYTDTLPSAHATYYPISGPRYPLGVIGVLLNKPGQMSLDQETLLQNFISQIGSTIEREQLNELAKKSIAYMESERLYQTLFNSLSHELRTPIAAILNASEGLLETARAQGGELQKNLTDEVHTAAERLNRLVANLLDMTRLESGRITPKLDWCDVTDLLRTTAHKLGKEMAGHTLMLDMQPDLPLLKLDYGLMEQAVTNLLHNAIVYTPPDSKIELSAFLNTNELVIIVADNGPGLPKDALPHLFEKFYRVPGTKSGGSGLGLSIAKGFIEVHKGSINVENQSGGGARFVIRIPVDPTIQLQPMVERHE